jgi:hypothetical protein
MHEENDFNIESYLTKKCKITYKSEFYIIDRLCKKIDVVKKVYQYYSFDLLKKKSNQEINDISYILLLEYIISKSQLLLDYKILNSALNLNQILIKKGIINKQTFNDNSNYLNRLIPLAYEKLSNDHQ